MKADPYRAPGVLVAVRIHDGQDVEIVRVHQTRHILVYSVIIYQLQNNKICVEKAKPEHGGPLS